MQSQAISKTMSEGGNRHDMALELFYHAGNLRKSVWGSAGPSHKPFGNRFGPGQKQKLYDFRSYFTPPTQQKN
jgi:hypothetical protein